MTQRTSELIYTELLVMRCQNREKVAFNNLYTIWAPRLLYHIKNLIRAEDPAKDILQDGWIAIMGNINKLKDPAAFPAWAYRIMTNKARDWQRKHIRQEKREMQSASDDVASIQAKFSDIDLVRKAIQKLSGQRKQLINLYYYEEYTIEEISGILNIKTGTVKSRLFRARRQLKETIERMNHD